MSKVPTPNLDWYTTISRSRGLPPRCPFASVHRCPRFYQSLSLLGEAGSTKIQSGQDKELLEKWRMSDLWPATTEQATSIFGPAGQTRHFVRFCPEVTFERFGLFASSLHDYADETDRDLAHAHLGKGRAGSDDWRWTWANTEGLHYSECPLYSLLAQEAPESAHPKDKPPDEIMILKPSLYGIGINLKALFRRLFQWLADLRGGASS